LSWAFRKKNKDAPGPVGAIDLPQIEISKKNFSWFPMVLVSIIASFFNAQAQPVVELYLYASLFFEAWVCLLY
jgi:hypothetical protein